MTNLLSARAARSMGCLAIALLLVPLFASAQATEIPEKETATVMSLDDFTERHSISEKPVLDYQPIREADILWEKRIWRIVDVREKMNQHFVCPEAPFFRILVDAGLRGDLPIFSNEDDSFKKRLAIDDFQKIVVKIDTVWTIEDFDTGEGAMTIVHNDLNWEDVKRYRIKEAWFFDTKTGSLRTQIGRASCRERV